jgi:TolA-binding protein
MKKSLMMLLLVLVVATGALAQAEPAQQQTGQQPAAGAAGQPPAQQKQKIEIKDPAEYNAYMAAVNSQDPNAKASALESFLQTYPNSVIREDALELLMKTYQQLNNVPKIEETGQKLLQVNPNNLTALALLATIRLRQPSCLTRLPNTGSVACSSCRRPISPRVTAMPIGAR